MQTSKVYIPRERHIGPRKMIENQLILLEILIGYPYRTQYSDYRYDSWSSNKWVRKKTPKKSQKISKK